MLLGLMRWKDVERYLRRRRSIIVPLGSVEEHGHHLPLLTDLLIAQRVAEELGRRTRTLVAPPIVYGVCRSTSVYPGTVSVSGPALKSYLRSVIRDLIRNGFKRIFLLSGHAGRGHLKVIRSISREFKEVKVLEPYRIKIPDVMPDDLHAGEVETSLMMHLYPEMVKDAFRNEIPEFHRGKLVPTTTGVFGYPSRASASKGRRIFRKWIMELSSEME